MKTGRRRHSLQEPSEKIKGITVGSLAIYKHRRNSGGVFVIAYPEDGGARGDRLQLTSFTPAPLHSHKAILPLAPSLILNHSFATCIKKYIRGKEVADKVIETVFSTRKLVNVQCTLCFVRVWGPEGINYKQGRQGFHQDKHAEDVCRVGQCYIYIHQ